eukprot:1111316-Pyramimonas_sp.AAC.1
MWPRNAVPSGGNACEHRHCTWASGGAPYGDADAARGVPKWGGCAMRALPLEPAVELSATKSVRRVPKWGGGAMQTLGPKVELHMGPRKV